MQTVTCKKMQKQRTLDLESQLGGTRVNPEVRYKSPPLGMVRQDVCSHDRTTDS